MGKNSSKIDQDTTKTVKRKNLKNNSFCLKLVFFNVLNDLAFLSGADFTLLYHINSMKNIENP